MATTDAALAPRTKPAGRDSWRSCSSHGERPQHPLKQSRESPQPNPARLKRPWPRHDSRTPTALARIPHRGVGVGDVLGVRLVVHGAPRIPRFAGTSDHTELRCAARTHWSGYGADD